MTSRTTKRSASTERKADTTLVERTLALIEQHEDKTGARERAIGEHVLDEYFGGDVEAALAKTPRKPKSFALLAERAVERTRWTERDLRDAVSLAIVWRSLPVRVRAKLTARTLRRLASIDDVASRRAVAAKIASGEVKGAAAEQAIIDAGASERGGGRKPTPAHVRFASSLERAMTRAEETGALDRKAIGALDRDARGALAARLRETARKLTSLADRLD